MTFEEFLLKKKIDSGEFKTDEGALWNEWATLFDSLSEASFTSQKLYLINPIRRRFPLKGLVPTIKSEASVPRKPVFKPKIQ